jgi:hypothetical protein
VPSNESPFQKIPKTKQNTQEKRKNVNNNKIKTDALRILVRTGGLYPVKGLYSLGHILQRLSGGRKAAPRGAGDDDAADRSGAADP